MRCIVSALAIVIRIQDAKMHGLLYLVLMRKQHQKNNFKSRSTMLNQYRLHYESYTDRPDSFQYIVDKVAIACPEYILDS